MMNEESITLSPIRPLVSNDPNVHQFFPSQSLQDIISQLEAKPETKEKPKLLVLQDTEPLTQQPFYLPLSVKTKNVDKKTENQQQQIPKIPLVQTSMEGIPDIEHLNAGPDTILTTVATRSRSIEQRTTPKHKSRPSLFSTKEGLGSPTNFHRAVDPSSFAMIQSQVNLNPPQSTDKPIGSPLLPIRVIPGMPQFNVSHPEKVGDPNEFQRRHSKRNTDLTQSSPMFLTPKHKTLVPSFAPVNNEYLYNVFANKNGTDSQSNTPKSVSKNPELRSLVDYQV